MIFFLQLAIASLLLTPGVQIASVSENGRKPLVCEKTYSREEISAILEKVDKAFSEVEWMSAEFSQFSRLVGLGSERRSSGLFFFQRPGKMDWRYLTPQKQRFVANAHLGSAWFYQPELNQVTLADFDLAFDSQLPSTFLLGVGKLSEQFSAKEICIGGGDTLVLRLEPLREDPSLQLFELYVGKKNFRPQGARMLDIGGNETEIRFSGFDFSKEIPKEHFEFVIPRGIDIIDRRKAKSEKE